MDAIDRFVYARRALLAWMRIKRTALRIVELQFPKTHPFRKSVQNLNLDVFRYCADVSICKFADIYGDDLFNVTVDGCHLCAPTKFFYGESLYRDDDIPELQVSEKINRDKCVDLRSISLFYSLAPRAETFMKAVAAISDGRQDSAMHRQLNSSKAKFKRDFAKMIEKLRCVSVDHSQHAVVLMCLRRTGLPGELGKVVLSFLT